MAERLTDRVGGIEVLVVGKEGCQQRHEHEEHKGRQTQHSLPVQLEELPRLLQRFDLEAGAIL